MITPMSPGSSGGIPDQERDLQRDADTIPRPPAVPRRRVPAGWVDFILIAIAAADAAWDTGDISPAESVAAGVACIGLALRRRWPLLAYLMTLPSSWMLSLFVAPTVALYTLAVRTRSRWFLAVCVIATAMASAAPWPPEVSAVRTRTFVDFLYLSASTAIPVLLGQLAQTRHELSLRLVEIEEVRDHEQQLHAQAVLARERARIGREMHDVVSYQVSKIAVLAGALQVTATDPDTTETAGTIRKLSADTLDELRHMVTVLRAADCHTTELTPQPNLADLRNLLDTSGVRVDLRGDIPADIGAPAQLAIYRTTQEALTNIRKHAPGATATVQLWHDSEHVGVTISNTAPTRPALHLPSSRHGLIGLAERAALLHGHFRSEPTPDNGYRIELRLPR
ncbi:sensor histidine kinase [Nocardia wallacei]|uniref:sensor histidine kinase n=1 Tax=Nocardia wallacei TaxID=480035 RepID=UPI0024576C6E|nr:histidine kinase [Nocardia wallacei]